MTQLHGDQFSWCSQRGRWRPLCLCVALALGLLPRSAAAQCVPTPVGLVSWWPGDGTAMDLAGGNNGSLQGGATASAPGLDGLAFSFDGTNGYVQILDSSSLQPTNLTIEGWVLFSSLDSVGSVGSPAGEQCLVWKEHATNSPSFDLEKTRTTGGDVFVFAVSDINGVLVQVQSATLVATGVWYHVAAVRGPNLLQLFVNGQLESETNVSFPQVYGTDPMYFGSTGLPSWNPRFCGLLDEVSFYNRALAADEIAAIYAAGAAGKCKQVSFVSQPHDQVVVAGSNATFIASATGFGTLIYQWQFNGTNLAGASEPTLGLTNVQAANAGEYQVVVTNQLSSLTSAVAVLTVQVPPDLLGFALITNLIVGTDLALSVSASGTAPLSYQWQVNGVDYSGATSSNLVLKAVQVSDSGVYGIIVSNVVGSITGIVATVTVVCPLVDISPATLTNATAGVPYDQVLAASGGTPPYSYAVNQGQIPLGLSLSANGELTGVPLSPGTNSFSVIVQDVNGCSGTNFYSLTVAGLAPSIMQEPQSQTNIVGTQASFSVAAIGIPRPSYQWRKDGQNLLAGTNENLVLSKLSTTDAGNYDVVVTNYWGMATSAVATLTVLIPPLINVEQQSVLILPNSSEALVTIRFDRAPDFLSTDTNVTPRQADSLQYWINYDPTLSYWDNINSNNVVVIRGSEIWQAGGIPLRHVVGAGPPDPGGGWGSILGTVPFSVFNSTLVFSAPLALIGTNNFSYRLEWYSYGVQGGYTNDTVTVLDATNLVDYAVGADPLSPTDVNARIIIYLTEDAGNYYLAMQFGRRIDSAAFGLQYLPEVSADKLVWFSDTNHVLELNASPLDAEFDGVTVRDTTPITPQEARFIRLHAILGGLESFSPTWIGSDTVLQANNVTLFSKRMIRPILDTGILAGVGVLSLTDTNAGFVAGEFGTNGMPAYVELYDGTMLDIANTTTNSLALASSPVGTAAVGESYCIRPHFTVASVFGTNDESGLVAGANPAQADNVLLFIPEAQRTLTLFYYSNPSFTSWQGWVRADTFTPDPNEVIYPEEGVMVRRIAPSDAHVYLCGPIKTDVTVAPVQPGYNLLGTLKSLSVTLSNLNLYTGDLTTGMMGGLNPSVSDNLIVVGPTGSVTTYFYYSQPGGYQGWVNANGFTISGGVAIPPGSAFFIYRQGPRGFTWTNPPE